jgi:hypothetical protein
MSILFLGNAYTNLRRIKPSLYPYLLKKARLVGNQRIYPADPTSFYGESPHLHWLTLERCPRQLTLRASNAASPDRERPNEPESLSLGISAGML